MLASSNSNEAVHDYGVCLPGGRVIQQARAACSLADAWQTVHLTPTLLSSETEGGWKDLFGMMG